MRSKFENMILTDNMREVDNNLSIIEETLKDIIKTSIEQIKNDPAIEKKLISLLANHTNNIGNFLFEECERTNNKRLYKNIVKYMLFNK